MGAGTSQEVVNYPTLEKYQEKIQEIKRLLAIEDPETEPYKSKYQATAILKEISEDLKARAQEQLPDEERKEIQANLALANLKLGSLYIETEEMFNGEHALNESLAVLEPLWPERALDTIECLNQIGILWNNRTDYAKAETYLKRAEELYTKLDLSKYDSETREKFEDQFTLTLFYLAQVYGNSKNQLASASYCRQTLQRQLESKKYTPEEFVTNCLSLSSFYESEHMLDHMRQCVEAAMIIYQENPDKIQDKEALEANLDLIWGRYFLDHLQNVKKSRHPHVTKEVLFAQMADKHPKLDFDVAVPDPIENYDQAKEVFLKSMQCFNKAKKYFVLDGFVSDHINILKDISHLYGALIPFEQDPDRVCKMIRRRIDLLEPIIPQLNPQHFPFVIMQHTFRLGELYSELADMKMKILETQTGPTAHQVKKINELINKSIQHFTKFLKLFEVKGKEPEQIEPEQLEAYLMARFSLGRLYSRLMSDQPEVLVKTLKQSLAQYEWVTKYADTHPDNRTFEAEINVCRQMATLLPMKIQNIARTARNVGE